jgi:rhodanese-related sulfurtransferase
LRNINNYPTADYLLSQNGIPIIDIRTLEEWYQTGILKGSHTITFFDEMGQYDIDKFLSELHKIIGESKDSKFMLICRTGSRTGQISQFLYKSGYTNVINLSGGITYVMMENSYEIVPYNPSK